MNMHFIIYLTLILGVESSWFWNSPEEQIIIPKIETIKVNNDLGPVIGIDLGTTYSCVAVFNSSRVQVIENDNGNRITPSYVAFTSTGERLIGDAAKNLLSSNPQNTIFHIKRLMGREFDDPSIQEDIKHFPFSVFRKDDKPVIRVRTSSVNKFFTPEEISSMILGKMREIAKTYLGQEVKNAVVTVPAYFNDAQRQATKDAGTIAGLNVIRVINEPTAAAIAYGSDKLEGKRDLENILVYDLGGGTFDVSIVKRGYRSYRVLATNGDTHLGGVDFDLRVMNHFIKLFKKQNGKDVRGDTRALQKLRREVEKAKRILSTEMETKLEIESFFDNEDFKATLTRDKFEELNMDLFRLTLKPIEQVLKDADLTNTDIDKIILVGGSTRIPAIRQIIKEYFNGTEPSHNINPDEVVASGAAILGAILSNEEIYRDTELLDVCPLTMGIEIKGDVMSEIIPRNTVIPVKKTDTYTTTIDNQTTVAIRVFEGERSTIKDNHFLGKFELTDIPPALKGVPSIEVTFAIDVNGILEVTAGVKGTDIKKNIVINTVTNHLSPEEIARMVKDAEKFAEQDKQFKDQVNARNDLELYIYSLKRKIASENLSLEDQTTIENIIAKQIAWLELNPNAKIDELTTQKQQLQSVATSILDKLSNENDDAKDPVQSVRRSVSSSSTINDNRFSLLWIDDNDREFTDDNYETQQLLRQYLPSIELESDISDAILFINRVKYTDKILIIVVSGQKASLLFQYLTYYDLNEDIAALYIFCNNPDTYQNLKHDRLYGIFNDPTLLVASIRTAMYVMLRESIKTSTNLLDQEQTWSRIIPAVTTAHIWYDLYLEILKILPTDEQAKEEMLEKSKEYYADDTVELLQIILFRYNYTTATAIEWYTDDTFVHKLVNKALRSENIELLSTFRFFIGDLSTAIKQEYINQQKIPGTIASNSRTGSSSVIKLFSGQVLPRMELERLEQNLGTVISINSFFSTSMKLNEARAFADRGVLNANMGKVLIEILLDTSLQDITAYAQTNNRTQFLREEEIVFDCGALFNVTSVEYDPFTNIWNIEMIAVSKTSINEHPYLTTIRETFIQSHSDIVTYGIIMGHGFDKKDEAIQYFNRLLSNYWFHYEDIPDILQQRGILYEKNGESALAVRDYDEALELYRFRAPKNLPGMASLYSQIGIIQMTTSDYQTSLNSHQQAMDIYDQLYTKDHDHVDKARVNVNIGLTYLHAGNASEALKYLTYAQTTYKRLLPEKHLFAIELLGHLGTVHETTGNFILAMELFYQQLRQGEEILPLDHPQLITSLDAIMRVQTKMNQTANISALLSEY
ncbi:unnamed protein product, partial [Adineta steineri]